MADSQRDLVPAGTTTANGQETVRLQQEHRGVPVLGGQYVVRMEKKDGERVVTGTSGKYFTELRTATTPEVGEELAVERAVDAVLAGSTKGTSPRNCRVRGTRTSPRSPVPPAGSSSCPPEQASSPSGSPCAAPTRRALNPYSARSTSTPAPDIRFSSTAVSRRSAPRPGSGGAGGGHRAEAGAGRGGGFRRPARRDDRRPRRGN
ncbi:hypothetical protein ACWIID_42840 [Streptomyces phaeochromogenes]